MTVAWAELRKRNAIVRKGWDFARQIPRAAVRAVAKDGDYLAAPPLVGNSFPKSGTHQLLQILATFPNARHFGSFIASMPSIPFREQSEAAHIRKIHALVPGEYLGAHIFYRESHERALCEINAVHFFIYRDLRDVAVSEANYLKDMNRWHQMHGYFAHRLKTDDERLMAAIRGVREPGFPFSYPDIGARMRRYLDWIGRESVFALKYEELNSGCRREILNNMAEFYSRRSQANLDVGAFIDRALSNLDPHRSHTFREGGSGGWRRAFNKDHVRAFREVAEDLNMSLGYEPC